MSNKSGYKQQQNLSIAQLVAELPSFVAVLVSKSPQIHCHADLKKLYPKPAALMIQFYTVLKFL